MNVPISSIVRYSVWKVLFESELRFHVVDTSACVWGYSREWERIESV